MKTISSMQTISSLNSQDSAKLIALLRAVGKKFYLGKKSCLHLTHEEFMSDLWSDRARIEYHGLSIVVERWSWNDQEESDFTIYYKGVEINPFQWESLVEYAKVILWYLAEYSFRGIYCYSLFKEEAAETLELKDEIRKLEKKSKKVREEIFKSLVKGN